VIAVALDQIGRRELPERRGGPAALALTGRDGFHEAPW